MWAELVGTAIGLGLLTKKTPVPIPVSVPLSPAPAAPAAPAPAAPAAPAPAAPAPAAGPKVGTWDYWTQAGSAGYEWGLATGSLDVFGQCPTRHFHLMDDGDFIIQSGPVFVRWKLNGGKTKPVWWTFGFVKWNGFFPFALRAKTLNNLLVHDFLEDLGNSAQGWQSMKEGTSTLKSTILEPAFVAQYGTPLDMKPGDRKYIRYDHPDVQEMCEALGFKNIGLATPKVALDWVAGRIKTEWSSTFGSAFWLWVDLGYWPSYLHPKEEKAFTVLLPKAQPKWSNVNFKALVDGAPSPQDVLDVLHAGVTK